jgi:carbonic anhydrase
MKGSEVLEKILKGNRRFLQGDRIGICNPVDVDLGKMVQSQNPIAAVLSCSDSRVPPEHVLDKKIGEIFVVRVAGKVPGPAVLGSLEYAVEHLKVPLLLVLGHERCGAVKAALEGVGNAADGALGALIRELEPAVRPVLDQEEEAEDVLHEAVHASVWYTMNRILESSPLIADAVREGDLLLQGAVYSLQTGEVTLLQ